MRSTLLVLLSTIGAVSCASTCETDDASSLLQARVVHKRAEVKDAGALLTSMRNTAKSLQKGSLATQDPAQVNAELEVANTLLQELFPLLAAQHDLAQAEIEHGIAAVQACHNQHGGEVGAHIAQMVTTEFARKVQCEEALATAIEEEQSACEGQGEDPNCLCNEARTAIEDRTALCDAVIDAYEGAFCENQLTCNLLYQCHGDELAVYNGLRAAVEAAMISRQQEYISLMQIECLMELIMNAMLTGTPIADADLTSCDDVSVAALTLTFPEPPPAPTACPAQSGDPQCGASSPWTLVLQYGEGPYTMNSGAVGVLNEAVNGHAKLSDEAINALPSGGDASYDYFMLTSDPPANGASDSTTEWDTMFLRTTNVGGYDDDDNNMGLVSGGSSWGVCNAATLDECTTWSTQTHSRFDTSGTTGNNCNRWFTGYNGVKCYNYGGNGHNHQQRCFSRGAGCTDGAHRLRTNVKIYKFTGAEQYD